MIDRSGARSGDRPVENTADFGCAIIHCGLPSVPDAPLALCDSHMRLAFAFVMTNAEALSEQADYTPKTLPSSPRAVPAPYIDRPGHVYFVRKDGLIKIGWSSQIDRRLTQLAPCDVLHVQPGTQRDERRCHAAFVHLRVHHEYFSAGPDLLAFIEKLKPAA